MSNCKLSKIYWDIHYYYSWNTREPKCLTTKKPAYLTTPCDTKAFSHTSLYNTTYHHRKKGYVVQNSGHGPNCTWTLTESVWTLLNMGHYPATLRVVATTFLHGPRTDAKTWIRKPCWHYSGIIKDAYNNFPTAFQRLMDTLRTHPLHQDFPFVVEHKQVEYVLRP